MKWTLEDTVTAPGSPIQLEINPDSVDFTGQENNISTGVSSAPFGQKLVFQGRQSPKRMQFSGTVLSEAQFKTLEAWSNKEYQFKLTDDLSRVFWIYITSCTFDRRVNKENWLASYTINATVLDWS